MRQVLIASLLVSFTGPLWLVAAARGFHRWHRAARAHDPSRPLPPGALRPGLRRPLVQLALGTVLSALLVLGYLATCC